MRKIWFKSANLINTYSKKIPKKKNKKTTQLVFHDINDGISHSEKENSTNLNIQKIQPLLNNLYNEQKFEDLKKIFKTFLVENQNSKKAEFYTYLHFGIINFLQNYFEDSVLDFKKSLELIQDLKEEEIEPYQLFLQGMIQLDDYHRLQSLANCMNSCEKYNTMDKNLLLMISHYQFSQTLSKVLYELEGEEFDHQVEFKYKKLIEITNITLDITHEYSAIVYYDYVKNFSSSEETLKKALDLSEKMENETQFKSSIKNLDHRARTEDLLFLLVSFYKNVKNNENESINYLKKVELRKSTSSDSQTQLLLARALIYFDKMNFNLVKECCDKIEKSFENENNQEILAMKSIGYTFSKEFSLAREYLNKLWDTIKYEDPSYYLLNSLTIDILQEYQDHKKYKKIEEAFFLKAKNSPGSMTKCLKAIEKVEKSLPDSFSKIKLYVYYFQSCVVMRRTDNLDEYMTKARKFIKYYYQKNKFTENELTMVDQIYILYINEIMTKDPEKSKDILQELIEMIDDKEISLYYKAFYFLGKCEMELNQFGESIEKFKFILEKSNSPEIQIDCCMSLAVCYRRSMLTLEVEKYLNQALEIAKEYNLENLTERIHNFIQNKIFN